MPAKVSMLAQARETSHRQIIELSPTTLVEGDQNDAGDSAQKKTRKRIRHFTSNDRAAHRVFERARREAFREKLIQLAELLPTLKDTDTSRLSKHTVVNESIARHQEQIRQIDTLTRERDELQVEVARWRAQSGFGVQGPMPLPESDTDLSSPDPLSVPLTIPLSLPSDEQAGATDLLLDTSSLQLPLEELSQGAPENAPWSWDTPFDLNGGQGEDETALSWGGFGDTDVSQLVVSSMAPTLAPEMRRTDRHREIEDVIVVNTADVNSGYLESPPDRQMNQMLIWMSS